MAKLLRAAQASDPFTLDNVHALTTLGKATARRWDGSPSD
ncbi:MAG: hypothetical protein QOF53_2982 [Nocardioidaceae bacterium]|jgi:hypothetical protein|nr:hypothetical protein [Nocardioidaceae bacterium]